MDPQVNNQDNVDEAHDKPLITYTDVLRYVTTLAAGFGLGIAFMSYLVWHVFFRSAT
jgi:hypothetical protein